MFTSRAEHRLLLRQDNADRRLMKYGYEFGLVEKEFLDQIEARERKIFSGINLCKELKFKSNEINRLLESKGSSQIDSSETVANLCRRPELSLIDLLNFNGIANLDEIKSLIEEEVVLRQIEIDLKYEGYLKRQEEMIAKLEKYEDHKIPLTLNYSEIKALSAESREKLNRFKPRSIGQASRISGVTPSDISVLLVYLKR
jgi:tRNA uridine 5-carboxymethylaminomethyl modification enzyme